MKYSIFKYLCWFFAALSAVLIGLVANFAIGAHHTKADIRLTSNIIRSIHAELEHALKGDIPQAIQYLRRFDVPSEGGQLRKPLSDMVEGERRMAIKEILTHLRAKTNKDFGKDPKKWIEALETNTLKSQYP